MDYTIIGNEVNLAARLQSRAELDRTLLAHETASLIKDTILTEGQEAVSVKGFAHPVRTYRVVGIHDDLEKDGRITREERDGFRLMVDLTKSDQASAIAAVENVLAPFEGLIGRFVRIGAFRHAMNSSIAASEKRLELDEPRSRAQLPRPRS